MKRVHSNSVAIVQDGLRVNVTVEGAEGTLKYFFYLYQDGVQIEKKKDLDQGEYSFRLYEDGNYFVKYIIRNRQGEDVTGKTKEVKFQGMTQILAPYRINYFGNSKMLEGLGVREYLNIEKVIDNISVTNLSEEEMLVLCKSLTENNPDSIIVDVLDEKDHYKITDLSEEMETKIYDQWVKFVKILRECNQMRVILINREMFTTKKDKKALCNQLNYFYEILYYAFCKYYHKIAKVLVKSQWGEDVGKADERIKEEGICRRELMKAVQWKEGPEFEIYTNRKENTIYIEAQAKNETDELQYLFSLCKDRVLYESSTLSKEKSKEFELSENGIYFVQVSVKNKSGVSTKNSKTFEYFDEKFQEEYQEFLKNDRMPTELDGSLEYYKGDYPYVDFGLVGVKAESQSPSAIEALEHFSENTFGQGVHILPTISAYKNYLISAVKPAVNNEKQGVLSGHCVMDEQYFAGADDFSAIKDLEQLPETTGQFSAVIIGKDDITLTTDFFNACRLYYYQDVKHFIIANRYHLLILLCKQMGITLELNDKQVRAVLSSSDIGYERQSITVDMNILGVEEVRTGFYWKLTEEGWKSYQNGLYAICNTKEVYHQEKYKEMLVKAKEEVVNVVEAIFDSPKNDKVVVDLSGGLDSRTVYSTVTNLTKNKEKIIIHAGHSSSNRDIEVATAINGLYDYPYDNMPIKVRYDSIASANNKMRSADLGIYYNRSIQQRVQEPISLKLIGSCGESMLRPYWVRNMYNTPLEYSYKLDDFLEQLQSSIIPKVNADYDKAFTEWKQLYKKELLEFPYEEIMEKFNYFSLAFGEVYHGHTILRNYLGYNTYMILLAKELLRISSITHPVFKSYKLHMDFIEECNPVLGVINYESKYYNDIKDGIKDLTYNNPSLSGAVTLRTLEDTTDWKIALAEKVENTKTEVDKNTVYWNYKDMDLGINNSTFYQLQKLMRQSKVLNENVGRALYYYLTYAKKSPIQILQYHHKLTSISDQLSLIE